jgi:hypothetical protein
MTRNSILLIISLVIVLGGGIYYFFFFDRAAGPALTSGAPMASDAELEFMTLVSRLDPIVFDTALLVDPRFVARQDIRTTILPESAGRTDPFAPLSGTAR